jgi:hypothetical protein
MRLLCLQQLLAKHADVKGRPCLETYQLHQMEFSLRLIHLRCYEISAIEPFLILSTTLSMLPFVPIACCLMVAKRPS